MARTVADQLADLVAAAGVERVYGPIFGSLVHFATALRRHRAVEWVPVQNEGAAAFAAGADARLGGRLAVCVGSWETGGADFLRGLLECHRSHAAVLAIVVQHSNCDQDAHIGLGVHPCHIFGNYSRYSALVSDASQLTRAFEIAIRTAISASAVSVVVISDDLSLRAKSAAALSSRSSLILGTRIVVPDDGDLGRLAETLNAAQRITMLCGRGCAEAHAQVVTLAFKMKAAVVHTLNGKGDIDYDNPYSVGMAGPMGHSSAYFAMNDCDVLLMLGSDFPYQAFLPKTRDIIKVQIDVRAEQIGQRTPIDLGLLGDIKATITALLPRLFDKDQRDHLDRAVKHYSRVRAEQGCKADRVAEPRQIHPYRLMTAISDFASSDAIFICEPGAPVLWAGRFLRMNGKRCLLGSHLHQATADTKIQTVGTMLAFQSRQIVSLCADGDFSVIMRDLQKVISLNLPLKIVVFTAATQWHGGARSCQVQPKRSDRQAKGFDFIAIAKAAGLFAVRLEDVVDVDDVIRSALSRHGPAVIEAVVTSGGLSLDAAQAADIAKLRERQAIVDNKGERWTDLTGLRFWSET